MFEQATDEEIIQALEGGYGPEAEVAAVTEAIDGDLGPEFQNQVLMYAVQGAHGESLREEALEIAEDEGFVDRWEQEAAEEEADPEDQEETLAADLQEAEERMTALLAAEQDRLERRFGPLSERERQAMIDAIPEGAFDGGQMPDLVETFGPELEKLRDRSREEDRLDAGVDRARELLTEREAEEAAEAGRPWLEQHLHGDDPEPQEGSQDDRIERAVQVAWEMRASEDEIDRAAADFAGRDDNAEPVATAAEAGDDGGGEE